MLKLIGSGSVAVLVFVGCVLFAMSLGCGGSKAKCTGSVKYEGKTFDGAGADGSEAKRNACNNYCRDADPEYDARYRIWLDSPKGKAAKSPSKQEAIFKDSDLMDFVTVTCSKRCVQQMDPTSSCN